MDTQLKLKLSALLTEILKTLEDQEKEGGKKLRLRIAWKILSAITDIENYKK